MGTCGSWSSVGPGLTQPCSSPCGSFVTTTSSWRSSSPSRGVALCTMSARRPHTGRSCIGSGDGSWNDISRRRPRDLSCSQNAARLRATRDNQFRRGATDALILGTVSYVVSKNTGKVRNVMVDADHVLSLRAADGLFTLKAAGAQRLHRAFHPPQLRIIVDANAVPFVREGKNVFAKFVREADPEVRPRDEMLVVSPDDELCAVAQSSMNRREMLSFK